MVTPETAVHTFDPLADPRWPAFLTRHPQASVFHTREWLEALRRTYGYEPIVYSTCPAGTELTNGVIFCRVRSWLTGSRLVSVPFADHCEPLVDGAAERIAIVAAIRRAVEEGHLKYAEIRETGSAFASLARGAGLEEQNTYCFHALNLQPSLDELYRNIHKSAIKVQLRRAEREELRYDAGNSEQLLDAFYRLLLLTRRRHRLPPQPIAWFQNLINCFGEHLTIGVASKNGDPIAGILTMRYKEVAVYKYGCSDARVHNLGGVPFVVWNAVKDAKSRGMATFDLGRSDADNVGLITFKQRWGATASTITYWRCSRRPASRSRRRFSMPIAQRVFDFLPDELLITAGKLLYRHIA
jgi:GNAT acetyltransferase-like protein